MTPFPAQWGMLLDPEFQRKMRGQGLYGYSPNAALQEQELPSQPRYQGVDLGNPSTVPAGDPSIPPFDSTAWWNDYNQKAYPFPPEVDRNKFSDGGFTRIGAPDAPQGTLSTSAPGVGVVGQKSSMNGAVPISLLAAGLGMLANNTGHYGAAGPVIGKGGLIGVQAYGEERDRQARDAQMKVQNRLREEQIGVNREQAGFMTAKMRREQDRDNRIAGLQARLEKANPEEARQIMKQLMIVQGDTDKAYAVDYKENPKKWVNRVSGVEGSPKMVKDVIVDPETGKTVWEGTPREGSRQEINNILPPLEKAEQGAKGTSNVKDFEGIKQAGMAAAKTIPQLQVMLDINSKAKMGWNAPVQEGFSAALNALGVPDAGKYATNAETFRAFVNQQVLDAQILQKGPQTESDARRLEQTQARLTNTNEANDFLLRYRIAQLNKERMQKNFYDSYWNKNKTFEGVDQAWESGPGSSSLFDDPVLAKHAKKSSMEPKMGSAPGVPRAKNPKTGEVLEFRNGQWQKAQ
jgi:hypothetical protein